MRTFAKAFALLVALVVAGVLALCGDLYLAGRRPLTLPPLRGPFDVGRTSFDWVDETREDTLAVEAGHRRELMVWVWYPAARGSARPAPYLPEALLSADRKLFLHGPITKLLIHDPALVRSHSLDRPLVGGVGRYPVILFRPGFGALALQYATLAEDLASRGYVVVAIDAPYSAGVVAFPDGRVLTRSARGSPPTSGPRSNFDSLVAIWSADTSFVTSKLAGLDRDTNSLFHQRLDLNEIGAFGHSFGGAAAAEFCVVDMRCKAAFDLDGLLFGRADRDSIAKPFMLLLTDHSGDQDREQAFADFRRVYGRLGGARMAIEVRGMRHFNVSDLAFLRKPVFVSRAVGALGPIDRKRGMTIVSDYVAAFFDAQLKGKPNSILNGHSPLYPEVRELQF